MEVLIAIALAAGVGGFIWYAVRNAGRGSGATGDSYDGGAAFIATDMSSSDSSGSDSSSCDASDSGGGGDGGGGDCGGGGD